MSQNSGGTMTIEDTIKWIEILQNDNKKYIALPDHPELKQGVKGVNEAYNITLAILSKEQEREKGCDICQIAQDQQIMVSSYKGGVFADSWQNVNYCPMCGRNFGHESIPNQEEKTLELEELALFGITQFNPNGTQKKSRQISNEMNDIYSNIKFSSKAEEDRFLMLLHKVNEGIN